MEKIIAQYTIIYQMKMCLGMKAPYTYFQAYFRCAERAVAGGFWVRY